MARDHLQKALACFQAASQADARIAAAFAGGSLASGGADEYSDLDLYLIIEDEGYASFFAERAAFMRQLGEPAGAPCTCSQEPWGAAGCLLQPTTWK